MDEQIRILHVFGRLDRGGAETMVMNIYRNINRNKIQFDFVIHTEDECDYNEEIISMGGRIHSIPKYNGINHMLYKKAWNELFMKYSEYKIIHSHVRSTASIYLQIANKYNLVTISHSHSTSSGKGFKAIIKNILQYRIRYVSDYLIACSYQAGVWLFGKKACNKDNFFVVNNAIETNKFIYSEQVSHKIKDELGLINKFVIGHIGRFNPEKNHSFVIDVFKEIYNEEKNVCLIMVGDGELRYLIEKKVNDLGLANNVIFTGVRTDIPELLQAMDIFVFPSLWEGFPVTLVEAQAAGLPCIVSDSITEDVKITNLVKSISLNKSPKYWADKIINFTELCERRNTHTEIVNAGFDISAVSKYYEKFYISISKKDIEG